MESVTVSPNLIGTEQVKQDDKIQEFISIERTREKLVENKQWNGSNLLDKEFKALVIRMKTVLGKIID